MAIVTLTYSAVSLWPGTNSHYRRAHLYRIVQKTNALPVGGRLLVARESSEGVVLKWYDEEGSGAEGPAVQQVWIHTELG